MVANSTGIVSGWVVQLALITLEKHGVDVESALHELDLSEEQLRQAHLSVDRESFRALLRYGADALDMSIPEFGYLCGQHCELNSFGPIGFAAMSAATFAETVAIAARFLPLACPMFRIEQQLDGDMVELIVRDEGFFSGAEREAIYWWMFGAMNTFVVSVLHDHLMEFLPHITIKMAAPANSEVSKKLEQDTPWTLDVMRFDQDYLALYGPASILDLKVKMANKFTVNQMVASSEQLMAQCQTSVSQRVRDIMNNSEYHIPSLDEIAGLLHMSQRSIHRALEKEGTTFREITQHVRTARAKVLLAQSNKSITEISDLLGFSSTSSFSTAFKRLCGVTPREFSARYRAD